MHEGMHILSPVLSRFAGVGAGRGGRTGLLFFFLILGEKSTLLITYLPYLNYVIPASTVTTPGSWGWPRPSMIINLRALQGLAKWLQATGRLAGLTSQGSVPSSSQALSLGTAACLPRATVLPWVVLSRPCVGGDARTLRRTGSVTGICPRLRMDRPVGPTWVLPLTCGWL